MVVFIHRFESRVGSDEEGFWRFTLLEIKTQFKDKKKEEEICHRIPFMMFYSVFHDLPIDFKFFLLLVCSTSKSFVVIFSYR